ncbi:MAG TPA: HAMP domain-containing sensor histidine kinase [Candidatus Saccharimonadales bacterium]|nr:HAMP domain-containing sensor histidine kinase [Candidatus Saccharimonadales bacterium]
MFRSATFKLTLWYVLLAASLCLLFSAVIYHLSTDELGEALNHQYNSFVDNDRDRDNIPLPQADIQRHGQHLFGELVWFNIVVIAGSSIAGYFLARRTLRPIKQAHQAQIRFTAEASHELRTPLAAMRADTEVALMEKGLPARAKRTLEGNLHDIERLEQLTGHLLDIARYQNKTTELRLLDLDEIVRDAAARLNRTAVAQEKNIRIKQDIRPVQVMGEHEGLQQLVTIVLDNAIKYSHEKGGIAVSLHHNETAATITIQDDGIGIPGSDVPHVFERFYRSGNTRLDKKAPTGYGLGLPLAQEIAHAHGGTIHIHSQENVGTTVRITLPLTRE